MMNGYHLGLYSHKNSDQCTYIVLIKYGTTCFTCNNKSTWLLARHERTNLICSHAQAHLSSKAIMSLQKTLIKQLESYDYILNYGYLDSHWRDRKFSFVNLHLSYYGFETTQ